MKLHFNFRLSKFRYDKIVIKEANTAIVYGSSEEFGGNGSFKIHGMDKLIAFNKEILLNLDKDNPEFFILCSGSTIFGVSTTGDDIHSSQYLLVFENIEKMNELISLEHLNKYVYLWLRKHHGIFD